MSTASSEYSQVWQRVKQWPIEMRQDLATQIAESIEADLSAANSEWSEVKDARRCELIDNDIQGGLSETEKRELELLPHEMRVHYQRVAPVPVEGARKLHKQLLEKKRRQEESSSEES